MPSVLKCNFVSENLIKFCMNDLINVVSQGVIYISNSYHEIINNSMAFIGKYNVAAHKENDGVCIRIFQIVTCSTVRPALWWRLTSCPASRRQMP